MKKINLIIIESDDAMFDRLNQDLKDYSPYVNKIYRSSYHNDVYKINFWHKCKLIIANNPEDSGVDFFKSLYLNPISKKRRIYGIIYTRSHENDIHFYRITRFLHEWSDHLFLGVIYKRYGSLEKILEIIRNIANNLYFYSIIDWIQRQENPAILNPLRLELLRKLHNLKHQIFIKLQPLISNLTEFNENKDVKKLRNNLKNNEIFFENIQSCYLKLHELIREFLQLEFKNTKLDSANAKSETSFYVKNLKKFINLEQANALNNLGHYVTIFDKNGMGFDIDYAVSQLTIKSNNGFLENFLKEYDGFIKSLNKLINLLDEHYFLA